MELLLKYFHNFSPLQKQQFNKLPALYQSWNSKINVISRKDMDAFMERHVLHSLGISKIMSFSSGTKVLDLGTGGGFPGIPLAIMYPDVDFLLVDSIGKKIKVVQDIAHQLGLKNVRTMHQRAEELTESFDFVVSRAVTQMPVFIKWIEHRFLKESKNIYPNGILYLKGGDLTEEMNQIQYTFKTFDLSQYYEGDFFNTKKVIYVRMVN